MPLGFVFSLRLLGCKSKPKRQRLRFRLFLSLSIPGGYSFESDQTVQRGKGKPFKQHQAGGNLLWPQMTSPLMAGVPINRKRVQTIMRKRLASPASARADQNPGLLSCRGCGPEPRHDEDCRAACCRTSGGQLQRGRGFELVCGAHILAYAV